MTPSPRAHADDADGRDPARAADLERATANTASRLHDREIELSGSETSEQLVDLLSAVEGFEAMVAQRGGDNMSNAPDSADPENAAYVLPKRRQGEPIGAYTWRIREAAERLEQGD